MVRRPKDAPVGFRAHLEYLYHINCAECSFYWTYASMEAGFDIEKRPYTCPNCGAQGKVDLRAEGDDAPGA